MFAAIQNALLAADSFNLPGLSSFAKSTYRPHTYRLYIKRKTAPALRNADHTLLAMYLLRIIDPEGTDGKKNKKNKHISLDHGGLLFIEPCPTGSLNTTPQL